MSQRMLRCNHCGHSHPIEQTVCPTTGQPLKNASSSERRSPPASSPPSAGTASSSRHLLGKTVEGKYRFRAVLGEGGMGTVWEAENLALGRIVAVKVLHPSQVKKKTAVKRFHREARAAGKIGHPNICEVYDFGTLEDGAPYIVMEKLVGVTLADRIAREGGLPFEDVIDIVNQVLSGLVAAHEKEILHRDIKPDNVFLTQRAGCPPLVKILDFGVSKMLSGLGEGELDLTRTGMVMGTPFYMSPEQARGERNLDARVDLWASGVILYEALTGRRPFIASNYNALLRQILTTSPRPARELRPELPPGFDAILERALARAREDRYPSAIDFQRDLHKVRSAYFDATKPPPMASVLSRFAPLPSQGRPASPAKSAPPVPPPVVPPNPAAPRPSPRVPLSNARSSSPSASSDPLARLPSLEVRYDDEGQDTSGTHIGLDLLDSGEMDTDAGPPPAPAAGFDDIPTEVARPTWEEETTRRPPDAAAIAAAMRRAASTSKPQPPPANLDDTIKIEGDIEEHFKRMDPETSNPRSKR